MTPPNPMKRMIQLAAFPVLALSAGVAIAQARVIPSEPLPFERVTLRQTVDSCVFADESTRVSFDDATITVLQPPRQCLVPGPPEVVDIQLGAFPAGEYRVEIRHSLAQPPTETIAFTVTTVEHFPIDEPSPAPLAHYGGVWWNASESGWGLSLHHGRRHTLFGALFVFGEEQRPQWFTLTSGAWQTSTRWSGELYRSTGAAWSAPVFDPDLVQHDAVGTATLDFTMEPGGEDLATLEYTIDGTTVTKTISRFGF